ncbi:DNA topoisomerase IB [Allokutzneria sp. A3M-2-11 16]|uniref:DNA topoisomerase IB n=1 Tax=Allokutzneria sp. A3M-2-11 16 TaxID=2962043 RepID=UPI0020B6DA5A|nr:DNA topoisomerase IB [Allokutzneria sp. A3M-2-11 16]MCP3799828.1 DNA topoisomerase IB [Allokutzneria sp. A3M-2-11 16]
MRLRRSDPSGPGLTRRRCGRGFRYFDPRGPVDDPEVLERIKQLVIPPAWQDVWICTAPNGHIQAVGVDEAGRKQYLYHPSWTERRDAEKFDRVLKLGACMPKVREEIAKRLDGKGLGRDRVLSASLRLLELGAFRSGGHAYAKENGSFGLSTLLREHVTLRRGRVLVRYVAKGGLDREVTIEDPQVREVVRGLLRRRDRNPELLSYWDGRRWHNLRSPDINDYVREITGGPFTAKDVRTWNGTVLAAIALAATLRPESKRGRRRAVTAAMREVSEELGNTPAVCRKSYVDPYVIDAFEHGITTGSRVLRVGSAELAATGTRNRVERAVLTLLRRARKELDPPSKS